MAQTVCTFCIWRLLIVSSNVKSVLRYSIVIYVRRVVYDMAINVWVRITINDKYCSRRVDLRTNSIKISIGGDF